jgi:hypothetical protein
MQQSIGRRNRIAPSFTKQRAFEADGRDISRRLQTKDLSRRASKISRMTGGETISNRQVI